MKRYLYSFLLLVIVLLSLFTGWYNELSIVLGILILTMLLDKMGKGIVLRETIAFIYVLTCLIMPIIGYKYYDYSNFLSRLWVLYMRVPEHVYFPYALPAISLFCFALTLPFSGKTDNEEGNGLEEMIIRIKSIMVWNQKQGLIILGIGLAVSVIVNRLPAGLQFFANLFFFGSFAGFLYIYYSPKFKYKFFLMILFALFLMYNAINGGMFTIVAYMSITIFSFLILNKRTSLIKKMIIFCVAAFLLIVLQNVKLTYRDYIWKSNYTDNRIALFANIFWQNIAKGDQLVEQRAFFLIYARANQGYNVSLVMRRMPSIQPYDKGSNLLKAFGSAFVPRFLWPDKPEAGGKFNMAYYAGWIISGWSTNVGPLGEAYGSFGVVGGIIYMFFLGLFIRWGYVMIFKTANKIPLLICWLPVFYFQVISSAETDSLQIFNSLIKASFFVWLLYKFLPQWFGKATKVNQRIAAKRINAELG